MDTTQTVQHFLTHLTMGQVGRGLLVVLAVYGVYLLCTLLVAGVVLVRGAHRRRNR